MKSKIKNIVSKENITLKTAIEKLNTNGKKSLVIIDTKNKLKGVLTDGDIRHAIKNNISLNNKISNLYSKKPIYIYNKDIDIIKIKKVFLKNKIFILPVINKHHILVDVYFVDDLLKQNSIKKNNIFADVFIMAGGMGKRLLPITEILPKPLFPVNGQPIIQKIINDFQKFKIQKFFISLNYKSEILKAFLNEFDIKKKFNYVNEIKPLGTVGSIKLVEKKISNSFFLINADIYVDLDYAEIFNFHKKNKNDLTIVSVDKEIIIPYGNCHFDHENNLIKIEEKPKYKFSINSGIYVCDKKIIKLISKNSFMNMDQLIKKCLKEKFNLKVYKVEKSNWTDIGQWSQYNQLLNK